MAPEASLNFPGFDFALTTRSSTRIMGESRRTTSTPGGPADAGDRDKIHEGVETQVRQDMFHRCQHRETGQQGMAVWSRPGQALDGDCSADTVDTVLDHHRLPQQRGERCR